MAVILTLIVHQNRDLAAVWARFLEREGLRCQLAVTGPDAFEALRRTPFDAVVLDVEMGDGGALAIADFAAYRHPDIPVIAVTASGFFSDSAIFELIPNARGLLREPLKLPDMAALIAHYGGRYRAAAGGSGGR